MPKKRTVTHPDYHFFYGGPFSQWRAASFVVDGVLYNCAEQFMMAKKALLFQDEAVYNSVMETDDPSEQKAIGKSVVGYSDAVWHAVARDVVARASLAKFQQNPPLLHELFKTQGKTLVEASPTDVIWGIGLDEDDPRRLDRRNWRGKNWLGQVLTEVRVYMMGKF